MPRKTMAMAPSSEPQRTPTEDKAVGVPLRLLAALAVMALALLAFASGASAEISICGPGTAAGQCNSPQGVAVDFETGRLYVADQGNNRIDVFESDGTFVRAFGWGVDTGADALQSCTTDSKCQAGIAGTGAGQFSSPTWIAVDNDPLSSSQHAVYVGTDSSRVQKFDSAGNFISAFGYDVVAQGANNSTNDETQALTVNASGGTFKLRFENPFSGGNTQETAPLPFNASAAEVSAALNSLSTIGGLGGSVSVTGTSPYLIDFEGNLAGDDVPALGTDATALTGTTPSIAVTEQHRGGALEVCEGKAGEVCKRGSAQAGGKCEISRTRDPIAAGAEGRLYVADSYAEGGFSNRVIVFDAAGKCLDAEEVNPLFEGDSQTINDFAVDSNGNFYVTVEGGNGLVRKFGPSGTLLYELGSNTGATEATEAQALAVDSEDNVFTKQRATPLSVLALANFITQYDSNGTILKRFGYVVGAGNVVVPGLAAHSTSDGDLYASLEVPGQPKEVSYLSLPPAGPVVMPEACKVKAGSLGNAKVTLQAEVNPEGKATTVHYEYVDQKSFEDEEGFKSPKTKTTPESASIGSDFNLHEANVQADVVPETEYRCRVFATNADGSATGQEGSFKSLPPLEIGETTVSNVSDEAATLNATVNPLGISTSGYFEYVDEATYLKDITELGPEHGFDHATKAPDVDAAEDPIDFGSGESFVLGSARVTGLNPDTSYRFRVVATDFLIAPDPPPNEIFGETEAFRTFGMATGALPDGRTYELVSPAQKSGAEVAVPGSPAGFVEDRTVRIQAGAGSGESVTYTSWTSFGEAEGAPATSQYLSKRTETGWETENISPFGVVFNPTAPPFSGFSPDLEFGAVKVSEPAIATGCPESYENLYLRDNRNGELHCLTPEAPNSPVGIKSCFTYAGASEDGTRAFFSAPIPYAGAPVGIGSSLYEWSAQEGLRVVSILPNGDAASPNSRTAFGAGGDVNCQWGQSTLRHAISTDGSRAFWTYVQKATKEEKEEGKEFATQLLVRVNGAETLQLDALPAQSPGKGPAGGGVFRAASADGSVVYFTDTGRLTSDSKAKAGEPDLYRYSLGKSKPLANLTKGSVAGNVRGVVGASDDGSYLYFVAGAVLSGEEENGAGQKAQAGKDNLYLFHDGEASFIATLASFDAANWNDQPAKLSARVSPDGRHLAFLSIEAQVLAGYDNAIATGEHCQWEPTERELFGSPLCPQAFLYDAEAKELTCASCNPSGSRPLGPTLLPGWSNVYEGPRHLSDDGSKLFFETYDALAPADQSAKRDVYEFEREGTGSCDAENPAFDTAAGGCHFLISSGTSPDESYFVDASSNGRDAFFSTRDPLVGWDTNENFDVYDAREDGGFPEPLPPPPACQGEACKAPPLAAPPAAPTPASATSEGPGNVAKPRSPRCPKGKIRKKARCVKPKPRHHRKQQDRKTNAKGRSAR
jgi:NHL repeat